MFRIKPGRTESRRRGEVLFYHLMSLTAGILVDYASSSVRTLGGPSFEAREYLLFLPLPPSRPGPGRVAADAYSEFPAVALPSPRVLLLWTCRVRNLLHLGFCKHLDSETTSSTCQLLPSLLRKTSYKAPGGPPFLHNHSNRLHILSCSTKSCASERHRSQPASDTKAYHSA
jgi:hypothetical protein